MSVVDAAAYADFLRAVGHRVVSTRTAYWYDASRLFFLSAPPNRLYTPTSDELRTVLRTLPCLGVRFAAPLQGPGKLSYQIVCDLPSYGLEALSGNVRSKVRRGLKRCRIEPLSFSVLALEGRKANADTVARQGREGVLAGGQWERLCNAAAATRGFEAWGAWCGEDLAAFLVTVSFRDRVEFLLARSSSAHLGSYPNNALIYSVAEEMLVRRGVPEITFGLESLEPVGPLDEFKFGMGFRRQPLRQRVIFHPLLRSLLRPAPVRALFRRWSERRGSEAMFWRKAAGLLRFAEEGGL
jgi:hypothetical protein